MRSRIILLLFILTLPLSARPEPSEVYEYSLRLLEKASMPRQIRLIRTLSRGGTENLISNGVLFTYRNRNASRVQVAGDFTGWRPRAMKRSREGVWYYFLENSEDHKEKSVSYKFLVDGVWISDPSNPFKEDDGMGSYLSRVRLPGEPEGKMVSYRMVGENRVQFRIYRPDARFVSIIGDFNNWNPENDILTKGEDGIWRITRRLSAGTYRYKFVVDGKWVPDIYNPRNASDATGEIASVITIPKK
jgi:1,4-alpha-glucan branching enzyme